MNTRIGIGFITKNDGLVNCFRDRNEFFEAFRRYDFLDVLESKNTNLDIDVLIVDSELVSKQDVITLKRNVLKTLRKVYYKLSTISTDSEVLTMMKDNGISIIPSFTSDKQCVDIILGNFELKASNNVVTFYGTDHKVGTTMIASSFAEKLKKDTGLNICYLGLSGNSSVEYFKKNTSVSEGLDVIKAKILNNNLDTQDITNAVVTIRGVDLIGGVGSLVNVRHYSVEHIEYLVSVLKVIYDIIVIDGGTLSDYEINIGALRVANIKVLVTVPSMENIARFIQFKNDVLRLISLEHFELCILNKVGSLGNSELVFEDIYKYFQTAKNSKSDDIEGLEISVVNNAYEAAANNTTIYNKFNNSGFNKKLDELIQFVLNTLDIQVEQGSKKFLKGIFSRE